MNAIIIYLSKSSLFKKDFEYHLIRAAMIFTFFIFCYQKWFKFEAHQISPFIVNGPLIFWLHTLFGEQGAARFLGTSELIFGTLLLLGFWNRKIGIVGALGAIATFVGTTTIIPFLPDAWAKEAGGFPAMMLPMAFLMKDFMFLAASIYLFMQDVKRAAAEIDRT